MKTTTKKLSDTKVELHVTLDAKDLQAAQDKAVERLSQKVTVPGFRKGKAPAKEAMKHMNPNELGETMLDIAVRTSVPLAFADAGENPLMIPEVNVTKFVPGELVEYTATAEILPEIKVGNFKGLKVKKEVIKVADKDVDEILNNIANSYAEKKAVKRKAKLGDEVIIDFVGKKDGEAFEGGSAKDHHLLLGSKQFIPGFEDGIVGHEPGDKFELKLTFPKDYHNKDLAGAKTVFEVLLKQVNEVKKPKLDNALAKKCGPFKTIDELKKDIRKNLEAQNEQRINAKYQDDLVAALVKKSTVIAPDIMIQDQLRMIKDDMSRNVASHGMTLEQWLKTRQMTEEEWIEKEAKAVAENRVKASLVLQVLSRDQKIAVEDKDVDARINELKEIYKQAPDALKQLKDPNVRQDIKNRMTIEKTIQFLVDANK